MAIDVSCLSCLTEFSVGESKVYLSPILSLFNSEFISYNLLTRPIFHQTIDMLDKAFVKIINSEGLILNSNQW